MKIDFTPDAPPPVPGRALVSDFMRDHVALGRDAFHARFPFPFMLQLNDPGFANPLTATGGYAALKPTSDADPPVALYIFPVRKRPDSNAFSQMVTIGRVPNNDIIIPVAEVSKFHASITRAIDGRWLVTDHSSKGTWVDGEKVAPGLAHPLETGARLILGGTVKLWFLDPLGVLDYLLKARSQLSPGRRS
jgi:hypothetical protein